MRILRLALLPAIVLPAAAYAAQPITQPITGHWITDDGKALVQIAPCGNAVCGRIERILAPTPDGPPVDANNPDLKLRGRPIKGLQVITGFTADGDAWKGRIYSPEEGKTYRSVIQRAGPDTLKVKGCVLFLCKTQTWKRAS